MKDEQERLIQERYHQVLERINRAAQRAGRSAHSVRLLVVTKTHPVDSIRAVVEAGARYLGENYADEAVPKIQALAAVGASGLAWHMIGHVQSRKAGLVCQHFNYLHSLDRFKLAERLDRLAVDAALPVLLECNVSGEESKFGLAAWEENRWDSLSLEVEKILALPRLKVQGLMTMAPFFDQAEPARPYFRKLRRLQEYLAKRFPQADWSELSMGMSGDFEVAIEEGATWVRIGSSIMGARSLQSAIIQEV